MDRTRVPSGSNVSLEKAFDNAQSSAFNNLTKRFSRLTQTPGIITRLNNGVQDSSENSLKLSYSGFINNQIAFVLWPGLALLKDGRCIEVAKQAQTVKLSSLDANSYYLVSLKYAEVGSEPVATMTGFMFDKDSTVSKKNTKYSDSYTVTTKKLSSPDIRTADDEIAIAIIKTASNGDLDKSDWSFYTYTSQNGTVDLRKNSVYRLDLGVLDDQKILFKDRDSVINANIEIKKLLTSSALSVTSSASLPDTTVNGALTVTGDRDQFIRVDGGETANIALTVGDGTSSIRNDGTGNIQFFVYTGTDYRFLTLGADGNIGNTESPEVDFHITTRNPIATTFRLESYIKEATKTAFDIIAINGENSDGRLEIKPVDINRPIIFRNAGDDDALTIDLTRNAVIMHNDALVTNNLTVEGTTDTYEFTAEHGIIGNLSATTFGTDTLTAGNSTLKSLTVTESINSPSANLIFYDIKNNTIGIRNTAPEREYALNVNGGINVVGQVYADLFSGNACDLVQAKADTFIGNSLKIEDFLYTNSTDKSVQAVHKFVAPVISATDLTVDGDFKASYAEKTYIAGTTSPSFRIDVNNPNYPGGFNVKIEQPVPTEPINFRIYDISPTDNPSETKALVTLKWNYDNIGIKSINGTEVALDITTDSNGRLISTKTNEIFDLTEKQLAGKVLRFASSGSKYDLVGYDPVLKVLSLRTAPNTAVDKFGSTDVVSIIDEYASSYSIQAKSLTVDGKGVYETIIHNFTDTNFVLTPKVSFKLDIGKIWDISIQAANPDHSSSYVRLNAGQYDPDHVAGGQSWISYTSPLTLTLPDITTAGNVNGFTLVPTPFGFNITIQGFTSSDPDLKPHEFEIAYTTGSTISWDPANDHTTHYQRIRGRIASINSNEPNQWKVGLRAVQNGQYVSSALEQLVIAGGGGIGPQEQSVVGPLNFEVTYKVYNVLTKDANVLTFNTDDNLAYGAHTLAGKKFDIGSTTHTAITNQLIIS